MGTLIQRERRFLVGLHDRKRLAKTVRFLSAPMRDACVWVTNSLRCFPNGLKQAYVQPDAAPQSRNLLCLKPQKALAKKNADAPRPVGLRPRQSLNG